MPRTILIADDERTMREALAEMLSEEGYEVIQAGDGKEACDLVLERPVDVVLSDLRMPGMDGMALLERMQASGSETPVIIMTACRAIPDTVAAMRAGAVDYLLKPVNFDDLLRRIERAVGRRAALPPRQAAVAVLADACGPRDLVGQSESMRKLLEAVRSLSAVKSNVLITGEPGTGKHCLAQAIHCGGVTRGRPFIAVDLGAIPSGLVESELLGYRGGAFTGATRDKIGYIEAAHGGTLLLDEVCGLPPAAQSSLLRALDSRMIVPLGDTRPRAVDVRVIAASNRDLSEMVGSGDLRQDLRRRLSMAVLEVPPLRRRKEDIPLLTERLLAKRAGTRGGRVTGITDGAMRVLLDHDWPGNIRELENVVERAAVLAEEGMVDVEHLSFSAGDGADEDHETLKEALRQFERQHIITSLRRHNYDRAETARCLGIGMSSLYRKLNEMDIPRDLGEADATAAPDPIAPGRPDAGPAAATPQGG